MIYNVQTHLNPRWRLVVDREAVVLRFRNKLNEEVCRRFIFSNLFNSLYFLVRLWWNVLVANLATNFQDLVAKVKNLVALAPVLGAISRPELYHWHCLKLFNSTPCSVFLAPDLSKHYPKLAIELGPSCSLVGSQSEHNVLLLLSPKGSASDIISLVIGFIHYIYVYFLEIMKWGSNEVSYTQIKSLLSIEKSLIDAWGQLLSYLTLSVN